jgi:MFS family permease
VIGLSGAGYYFGFIVGCWVTPWLLRSTGHIRAFAAMSAVAACASLAMVIVIDPFFWFLMRLVTGICFASLFANVESWINAQVTNNNRARTLAIYRFVDLGAVTLSQYMLPVFGIGGFEIFAVMTMLIILSIVPVSLADRSNPAPPAPFSFNPKRLFAVSPLACAGCRHRRPDHRLVPLRRPALCGGLGFRGVRYRLVHERGHHRRHRAAISAGLSVRQSSAAARCC